MLATANGELPSLPQVVLRMLDACDEDADYQDLGEIIGNDTALTARVLTLANSSYFRRGRPVKSLQHALLRLGIENLRTLVITAALRQFLLSLGGDQWDQLRDFWRHSLTTALLARALAHLTRYGNPDEGFLVGMLHNVGELLVPRPNSTDTPEPDPVAIAATGAALAQDWGLSPLAIDAIRYQHLPPDDIRDTPHLVKLISLATRLAVSDKRGIDAAQTLFGLTAALTREICNRINDEVDSLAEGLGISLDGDSGATQARQALLERLVQHGMVDQVARGLRRAEGETALCQALVGATELLSDGTAMVLLVGEQWLSAGAVSGWPELELRLPRDPVRSLVARCAQTRVPQLVGRNGEEPVNLVVDQQLLDLLEARALYATPIQGGDTLHAILVAGFDAHPSPDRRKLLDLLAGRAAPALRNLGIATDPVGLEGQPGALEAQLQVRQLLHEVSNPLTVIRNYLGTLQHKLGEDSSAQGDLDVVREELDRISTLLIQSRDMQEVPSHTEGADLAREVLVLMELLEGAFFTAHGIECDVQVPAGVIAVQVPRGALRQIILNLARNAVEAMEEGGHLAVSVRANVWQNGQAWAELSIEDDGPGLPDPVRDHLFQPVTSGKGQGHSGLGLSIVKRLVDDTGCIISCFTDQAGTGFRILIPAGEMDKS